MGRVFLCLFYLRKAIPRGSLLTAVGWLSLKGGHWKTLRVCHKVEITFVGKARC